jgi:hypothetical protein
MERCVNQHKQRLRIATRFEKRVANSRTIAVVAVATWLSQRFVGQTRGGRTYRRHLSWTSRSGSNDYRRCAFRAGSLLPGLPAFRRVPDFCHSQWCYRRAKRGT